MNNRIFKHLIRLSGNSTAYLPERFQNGNSEVGNSAKDIQEHGYFTLNEQPLARLAPKLIETLKGKLSFRERTLQIGALEKIFQKIFSIADGEKLVKASQCYLSTASGPIAGLLFISTQKITFCSERPIKFLSPTGKPLRIYHKVSIPVRKIVRVNASQNSEKPSQKYMEIVTEDNLVYGILRSP